MNSNDVSHDFPINLWKLDVSQPTLFHLKLLLVSGVPWLWVSFGVGIVGFIFPSLQEQWAVRSDQLGLVASAGILGMLIGAVTAGVLADRLGRKRILVLSVLGLGIFMLISGLAWDLISLICFRFLAGLCMGAVIPAISTLISEFSPAKHRGRMMVALNGFWGLGGGLAAAIGFFTVPNYGWRIPLLLGGFIIFYLPIIQNKLPGSVRFLINKGRIPEAQAIFKKIEDTLRVPKNEPTQIPAGPQKAQEIDAGRLQNLGVWSPAYRKQTVLLSILWFVLNFTFNGVFIWLPSILVYDGYPLSRSFLFALVINFGQVPGVFVAAYLADLIGRKSSLSAFLLFFSLSIFLFGVTRSAIGVLVWGSLFAFCNGGSWGIAYSLTTELYPTQLRGAGMGWSSGLGRAGGIFAPYLIGLIIQFGLLSRLGMFALIAGGLFLTLIPVLLVSSETRGRALEEIAS